MCDGSAVGRGEHGYDAQVSVAPGAVLADVLIDYSYEFDECAAHELNTHELNASVPPAAWTMVRVSNDAGGESSDYDY